MRPKHPVKRFVRNNGLSICMFGLFAIFLAGLALTGYVYSNQELQEHHQAAQSFGIYLTSGDFIEAIFENWESEFLQMAALVIATIFLYQKGAADSRKLAGADSFDRESISRYSIIRADTWSARRKALGRMVYANSLSLALICLFLLSFVLHALGGAAAHNETAAYHGQPSVSWLQYITTSQFWFESFQNWQSEFLSVGILLVLSVYLRQYGSTESKPVNASNQKTGE